jgi:hypothetical protein
MGMKYAGDAGGRFSKSLTGLSSTSKRKPLYGRVYKKNGRNKDGKVNSICE